MVNTVSSYPLGDVVALDITVAMHEGADIVDARVGGNNTVDLIVQEDLTAPLVNRVFALRRIGDTIANGVPIAFATGNDSHTELAVFEVV